jgi:tetratricopeptide (TPR) repeat protein
VATALLVRLYQALPEREQGELLHAWMERGDTALDQFEVEVRCRYLEGTLLRLLESPDDETRRAAILALGLTGTMASNEILARHLHDDDPEVRDLVADTLWTLWFRAESEDNTQELHRLIRVRDRHKALAGLSILIQRAPRFGEAYNQRAILFYQFRQFDKAIADCQKVLELNSCHFGAQVGMGQCYLQLHDHPHALRAFRAALRIHPSMPGLADTIRSLEQVLGEEESRDERW